MRVARDPALLARALRDPGLRSKLPDKYLTAQQREQRRLNRPFMEGSALTNRDVSGQVKAAETLQFGPNAEARQQQTARDVAGWYDDYVRALQGHAANIGKIGEQSAGQAQGLRQGIANLGQGGDPDAASVRDQMIQAFATEALGRGEAGTRHAQTSSGLWRRARSCTPRLCRDASSRICVRSLGRSVRRRRTRSSRPRRVLFRSGRRT